MSPNQLELALFPKLPVRRGHPKHNHRITFEAVWVGEEVAHVRICDAPPCEELLTDGQDIWYALNDIDWIKNE